MRIVKTLVAPVSILLVAGILLYERRDTRIMPPSSSTQQAELIGRSYGSVLVSTYADAWLAAANALESGKSIGDSQKVLQETWKDGRIKAFRAKVQPAMGQITVEGTEPDTAEERASLVAFWRNFANGLKGGAGR